MVAYIKYINFNKNFMKSRGYVLYHKWEYFQNLKSRMMIHRMLNKSYLNNLYSLYKNRQ